METSSNLASVKPEGTEGSAPTAYKVNCSTRSSLLPALQHVRDSIARLSRLVSGYAHVTGMGCSASDSVLHTQRAYVRRRNLHALMCKQRGACCHVKAQVALARNLQCRPFQQASRLAAPVVCACMQCSNLLGLCM